MNALTSKAVLKKLKTHQREDGTHLPSFTLFKSKLTVMNEKDKSFVAEADLNLCDYKETDFYFQKLPLEGENLEDKNAFIEVGIRAT